MPQDNEVYYSSYAEHYLMFLFCCFSFSGDEYSAATEKNITNGITLL